MNEDFVPFELAVKLKEKGFDYPCISHYDINKELKVVIREPIFWHSDVLSYIDAPTISQALKWLRKEKKIHIVCPLYEDKGFYYYVQRIGDGARIVSSFRVGDDCFDTTEQAALACIAYVLDNLI